MACAMTSENEQLSESQSNNHAICAPSDEGALRTAFLQRRKKHKFREVPAPKLPAAVADTHAHLEMLQRPAANLARCALYGVEFVVAMCDPSEDAETTLASVDAWREEAAQLLMEADLDQYVQKVPHIRVAMGVHPHNASRYDDAMEALLAEKLHDVRICALGEVGLDYYYDLSPRETQREVFRRQIRLAKQAGIPLILHMREAHDEGFVILEEEGFPEAGVLLHCFNLDSVALAPWALAGCYIAYGGPLTFKKADEVREGATRVALNRLLTETDSPYMTPEPMRGIECGPEHVIFTAEKLCEVRGCANKADKRQLLQTVYQNALDLLDRQPTAWQRKW